MKSVGVIVEYNPFHNGHAFHLEESKKAAGADIAIAAMSGNFLQRGEPALVSKWTRAKMALNAGVDIVFELPYKYATQHAKIFAQGAISILSSAGCDSVCFGSESGDIHAFEDTYFFMQKLEARFEEGVKQFIKEGNSYPKALSLAFSSLSPDKTLIDLSKPNNILGFQYLSAAKKQSQPPQMLTITRKSAGYHDEDFTSETIASATSIRKALFSGDQDLDNIRSFLPSAAVELLLDYRRNFGGFHEWELYWKFLRFRLLQSSPKELREIYEVEEGIENRLLSQVVHADSFSDFMKRIKTKRYTWTRLQRICLHILLNAKKTEMAVRDEPVPYLRLLGMTENGREYLNKHKKHFSVPIISKLSSYKGSEIELDIRASRIYLSGLQSKADLESEFRMRPIMLHAKESER